MCFVINLAVADMLVGLHSVIVLMVDYNPVRCGFLKVCIFSPKILFLMFFVYAFFSLTSLTNMTKISIERIHAIFRQLKHRRLKKWVFRATITALWVLPAMVLSMTVFGFDSGSPEVLVFFWPIPMYHFFCLFVVIWVSCTCIRIRFVCWASPQHHGAVNRQRKLTVTLFIMTVTYNNNFILYTKTQKLDDLPR